MPTTFLHSKIIANDICNPVCLTPIWQASIGRLGVVITSRALLYRHAELRH